MENTQGPFLEWAKTIQKKLDYEYDYSQSILDHPGILGSIRENVIKNILYSFLPKSFDIGSGQLIDIKGNKSKQIDIIISNNTTPVFKMSRDVAAYLYETAIAVIEIKSMLYSDKLNESLDNIKSINKLNYMAHMRGKGITVFNEAFQWIDKNGGIEKAEKIFNEQDIKKQIPCPDDVWFVMSFIRYWLHWSNGDFSTYEKFQSYKHLLDNPEFDFFSTLLKYLFKEDNIIKVFQRHYSLSSKIKDDYFDTLFELLFYENLNPHSFVVAYKGFKKIENLLDSISTWYSINSSDNSWYHMPKVIINDTLVMIRHYNVFHCFEYKYPVLFFMNGICNTFIKNFSFDVSVGGIGLIGRYFDLGKLLGDQHPKYSQSYHTWEIPFDNQTKGEIKKQNP